MASWISEGNRSRAEMVRLNEMAKEAANISPEMMWAHSFIKRESYELDEHGLTKFPRTINAYQDLTKALYGPTFKAVEKLFFSSACPYSKHFVKKVPVRDRGTYIEEMFGDAPVVLADFSSFECAHRGTFAKIVCHCVNKMIGEIDADLRSMINRHMLGQNISLFKGLGIKVCVDQTLMSGAVWTSLNNCILCHLLVSYMRLKARHPNTPGSKLMSYFSEFTGVTEGDDSLTQGDAYDPELIEGLGIKLTSEVHRNCTTASFCGILKPAGVNASITDPIKVISNFFVLEGNFTEASKRTRMGLLRAKALSYYWQYSTCPVVAHFAFAVLKRTRSYEPDIRSLYFNRLQAFTESLADKAFYHKAPEIDGTTRSLFSELYGLDILQQQELEASMIAWGNGCDKPITLPPQFRQYEEWTALMCDNMTEYPAPPWRGDRNHNPALAVGLGVASGKKFLEMGVVPEIFYSEEGARKRRHKFPQSSIAARPFACWNDT